MHGFGAHEALRAGEEILHALGGTVERGGQFRRGHPDAALVGAHDGAGGDDDRHGADDKSRASATHVGDHSCDGEL